MKKALVAAAVTLLLLAGLPLFAQTQTYPKDAYYKSIPVIKVWLHPLGYLLQYFNSKSQVASIYVPLTWFNQGVNSKAEIVYGSEWSAPYAVMFWFDGKFDHIALYVTQNFDSQSWGVLENVTDRSAQFKVEDVPMSF